MSLIDGINQSEARRRALILFCITFLRENAKVTLPMFDKFMIIIRSHYDKYQLGKLPLGIGLFL